MASSRNSASPDGLRAAVADCLRRHLTGDRDGRLAVGFSGGRDSRALLSVLHDLQPDLGFHLSACHVNHGLSPRADEWQDFCKRCCDAIDVPLTIMKVSVSRASPEGLEAAARDARYAAFAEIDADWLVLGQHRDDQAETLLFNLLRGAGLRGVAGMPESRPIRPGLQLLRPLLGTSRADIENYLHARALDWIDDESNDDTRFTRNFLRHHVMPLLETRFPAAASTLSAASQRFDEAQGLLDDLAMLDIGGDSADFPLPLACIENLPAPRARNALRFLLARHGVRIPSEARLAEILRQLLSAAPDRHPSVVFGDWRIFRRRGAVHLERIC